MLNITEEEVNTRREDYRAWITTECQWLRATMAEIIEIFKKMAPVQVRVISEDQVALEGFCLVQQRENKIVVTSANSDKVINAYSKEFEYQLRERLVYELGRIVF